MYGTSRRNLHSLGIVLGLLFDMFRALMDEVGLGLGNSVICRRVALANQGHMGGHLWGLGSLRQNGERSATQRLGSCLARNCTW